MRVLIVEDEGVVAESLAMILKREKYDVEIASTGEDAIDLVDVYDYSVILLDLGLPDIDGMDILKHIRKIGKVTPVIILSGYANTDKKIEGLQVGADDYITKPFEKSELLARIQAILRRSKGFSDNIISVGSFVLNIGTREVEINNKAITLTKKEYDLLEILAMNKGRVVTKETLLDQLYGGIDSPDPKIIDVFVCKLRKKLTKITKVNYISTSWGIGYTILEQKSK